MAIQLGTVTPLPELNKINYSALDFDTIKQEIIDYIRVNYPDDQNDFLETNTGIMIIDILSYMTDVLSYRADFLANENYLSTARTKKAIIRLLELINYRLGRQTSASGEVQCKLLEANPALLDINNQLIEDVIISSSDSRTVLKAEDDAGDALYFELYKSAEDLTSNVIIPAGTELGQSINAVILQGRSQFDVFTADINSSPNQKYPLSSPDVLESSLIVSVNGALYTKVDNLAYENGATATYEVHFDENNNYTIVFGDNTFGVIPPAGAELVIFYRYGGGKRGNVVKGSLIMSQSFEHSNTTFTVRFENLTATTGGVDEETLEHAKNYAPKSFKTQVRTVTGEDYSVFASGYSDGTNGSISKAIATIRPYLVCYAGTTGPYTITDTSNVIRLYVLGKEKVLVLTQGVNIELSELISDFNTQVALLSTGGYIPPFEMISYPSVHYRYLGSIPEPETGYSIANSNNAFKVNYDSIVYTANLQLGTSSLDDIISELNVAFDTGDNSQLVLFRAVKYIDYRDNSNYLAIISTALLDPTLTTFELVIVSNNSYSLFGLSSAQLTEYDAYCPAIAMIDHKPEYSLEVSDVPNSAYGVLGLRYSTPVDCNGKAFPCSANYVDIYTLALGENDTLVQPSTALKDALRDFLGRFKQITDEIVIWDGEIKVIDLNMTITVSRGYPLQQAQTSVNSFISDFFNPDNNDFGLPLYISKVYEGIEKITGVNHIDITDVKEDSISQLTTENGQIRNVSVNTYQIWTKGTITLTYEFTVS